MACNMSNLNPDLTLCHNVSPRTTQHLYPRYPRFEFHERLSYCETMWRSDCPNTLMWKVLSIRYLYIFVFLSFFYFSNGWIGKSCAALITHRNDSIYRQSMGINIYVTNRVLNRPSQILCSTPAHICYSILFAFHSAHVLRRSFFVGFCLCTQISIQSLDACAASFLCARRFGLAANVVYFYDDAKSDAVLTREPVLTLFSFFFMHTYIGWHTQAFPCYRTRFISHNFLP